jgi:hypothetical protein
MVGKWVAVGTTIAGDGGTGTDTSFPGFSPRYSWLRLTSGTTGGGRGTGTLVSVPGFPAGRAYVRQVIRHHAGCLLWWKALAENRETRCPRFPGVMNRTISSSVQRATAMYHSAKHERVLGYSHLSTFGSRAAAIWLRVSP